MRHVVLYRSITELLLQNSLRVMLSVSITRALTPEGRDTAGACTLVSKASDFDTSICLFGCANKSRV